MGLCSHGELGNRIMSNSSLPVKVIGVSDVVSIAAGYYNSFAVRKDGTVWSWGYNNYGQLGLGDSANRTTAQQVLGGASGSQYLTDIVEVKAATMHTLALKANGTVYAWGYNGYGQLGSNGGSSYTPVQVVTGAQKSASGYLEKVVDIDVSSGNDNGYGTSIALTESKEVYGWGYSGYGPLGQTGYFTSPIKVSNINTAVGVALGGTDNTQFTYILKKDGTVSSLGYNYYGQLGNGKTDSANTELRDVQNLKNVVQIVGAQNGHFGAAVRTDGTVWAWGYNGYGQLGNSKNENSSIPVSVGYPPTTNFDVQYAEVQKSETGTTVRKYEDSSMPRSLSGGEAIAEDEQIVIDTSKLIGEQIFGFNLITDKSSSYSNAKDIEISSFDETLFTIKNGNTIVPNQNGKYGTGVVIIRDTDPTRNFVGIIRVQVKPKDAVATPGSAKQSSTVALKADGTVWTWGYNVAGQLGNNSTADSLIPVQVLVVLQVTNTLQM